MANVAAVAHAAIGPLVPQSALGDPGVVLRQTSCSSLVHLSAPDTLQVAGAAPRAAEHVQPCALWRNYLPFAACRWRCVTRCRAGV